MDREKCIELFNSLIESPNHINAEILVPVLLDYLNESGIKDVDKKIGEIIQNTSLLLSIIPKMIDYCKYKYNINTVTKDNQILLYF